LEAVGGKDSFNGGDMDGKFKVVTTSELNDTEKATVPRTTKVGT